MKLIRHQITKEFLRENGEWTRDRTLACDFSGSTEAIYAVLKYKLSDVEVVLQFGESPSDRYDATFPVATSFKN